MHSPLLPLFFFSCSGHHRDLHSFPTRRSSDLEISITPRMLPRRVVSASLSRKSLQSPRVRGGVRRDTVRWSAQADRKSTRLNSSHSSISYAVFCLKKKKKIKASA